jgi:hypothetical protein
LGAIVLIVAVRLIQWLINLTPYQTVKDQFTPKKKFEPFVFSQVPLPPLYFFHDRFLHELHHHSPQALSAGGYLLFTHKFSSSKIIRNPPKTCSQITFYGLQKLKNHKKPTKNKALKSQDLTRFHSFTNPTQTVS